MPNTRITKARLSTHLHYGKWVYLAILAAGFFVTDLVYTMTEYRPPNERKVDIELVGSGIVDTDRLLPLASDALAAGQVDDATLEAVEFFQISYSGDPMTDVYGAQKFTVMTAAGEGDVYIVPKSLMERLWFEAAALPLDDYVSRGLLDVSGLDLSACTLGAPGEASEDGQFTVNYAGETHLYAVPVGQWVGLADAGYPTQDTYAVVMHYSKNPETSVRVLQYLRDRLVHSLPEVPSP